MPISKEQQAAYDALPEVELHVSKLTVAGHFAFAHVRGAAPVASAEMAAEMRQAQLGLTRRQQLALVLEGMQELEAMGVVFRTGDTPNGPEYVLHPKVKVVTELISFSEKAGIEDILKMN